MVIYLLILLAFAADRLSKWWVEGSLIHGGGIELSPYLKLEPVYNRGIAFGMLQGVGPLVGWITIGIIIGLFITLRRLPRTMWVLRIGLALIIGGALGNLVDRLAFGEVLDFIETPFRRGIFNVADIAINLGLLLSLFGMFFHRPGEKQLRPNVGELDAEKKPLG